MKAKNRYKESIWKLVEAIQIFLMILIAIIAIICFILFAFHPQSNYGNYGGLALFFGAINILFLADRG